MLNLIQERILRKIAAKGSLTTKELDGLYLPGRRDATQVAGLNKRRLTEWVRPEGRPGGNAIGIQITDAGRGMLRILGDPR